MEHIAVQDLVLIMVCMTHGNPFRLPALLAVLVIPDTVSAKPFTLRLIAADRPEQTVAELETPEEKKPPEAEKLDLHPPPSPYVGWMRSVTLDGQDAFKITYKGAFLKRSAVVTADLADGEHVIQPGEHRFSLRDGRIVVDDPDIRAAGDGLDVLCYPVTFAAVDASIVRPRPLKLRRIPSDLLVLHGEEMILPVVKKFDPLVLYLVSNPQGQPYRLRPTGQAFRVAPDGVRIIDTEEARAAASGVTVENRFTVGIPSFSVPVEITTREAHKVGVKVYGLSGEIQFNAQSRAAKTFRGFYSRQGSRVKVGHATASEALDLEGDLAAFPYRSIRVDARDTASDEPRCLVVAWARQAFKPGEELELRVRYLDSVDVPTLVPAEISVFLRESPALRPDGRVDYTGFGQTPPPALWRRLPCRQTPGQPFYRARIPDRPTSIYPCRVVVDRAGRASPDSLLAVDFHVSISSADLPGTLSLFTDSLRSAYQAGEWLEFNVVLKNRQPMGGILRVQLHDGARAFPLVEKSLDVLPPGHHAFTYRIEPEVTAALAQGDYRLEAALGDLASPAYPLFIRQTTPNTHFPIFHYSWGAGHHMQTSTGREENPAVREFELRRNMRRLAHMNINVVCPVEWQDFYELRESSSWSAQVEKMMRDDIGMPASELAYGRTNFEIVHDEMIRLGQRHLPQSYMSTFGFRSLKHSILEDRLHEMRKYTLLAQDYCRFPNWIGFLTPKDQVAVLGNSETGDARWAERDQAMMQNFKAKYGHERPRQDQVVRWFQGDRAARERFADVETRWMHWSDHINGLLPGLQHDIRQAVAEVKPGVQIGAMTCSWFSAAMGEFISRMHSEMDLNLNAVGFGDYWRMFPLEEIIDTMHGRTIGFRQPQWRSMSEWSTAGRTNAKVQFYLNLMGQVDAMGYYSCAGDLGIHADDWRYDEYKEFNDWLKVFGDWYQCLELETGIAVYHGYLDSAHEIGGIREVGTTRYLAMGAIYELVRTHRIAPMIDEERVRQGDLQRYRIVILPGVQLMPDDVRLALEAFIQAGGIVLADEDTRVDVAGARRIPKNFRAMLYPYMKIGTQYDGNRVFWEAYKCTRQEVVKLEEILAPIDQPFASAPSSRILTSTLRHGDARYVFAVNDALPYWAEFEYYGAQYHTLPGKSRIRLRDTTSTVYSLFEGRTVDGPKEGDIRTLDADFEFIGAQVFALLPRPIAALRLSASESVQPGQALRVSAGALDDRGQVLRAAVPIELHVRDPSGQSVYRVDRSTLAEGFEETFPIGLNARPGEWRIEARDRLAGRSASLSFRVPEGAAPIRAVASSDVLVANGRDISQFLRQLAKEGGRLWILLGGDQAPRRTGLAKRLADALKQTGIRAEVKRIDDPGVLESRGRITHPLAKLQWSDPRPDSHIRQHVLLLGLEGENALIEEIVDTPILLRRFTRNYPGDGRALLELVHSPFATSFKAILVLSTDESGLERGVERLLQFERFESEEPDLLRIATLPPSPAPLRQAPAEQPPPAPSSPVPNRVADQEGIPVSCLAFSPEGDAFAVGCSWYFHNLFLFDRAGQLLWKQKIGRSEVRGLTLSRGGERLCAVTDQGTYLLDRSGRILWRFGQHAVINAAGNLLFSAGADLTLALRPDGSALWVDDPWLEETDPWRMNTSSNLADIAFLEDQKTVVLRNGRQVEFRDAATNRVLHQFSPQAVTQLNPYDPRRLQPFRFSRLQSTPNGEFLALLQAEGDSYAFVFRRDGSLVQESFLAPPYYAHYRSNDHFWLGPEGILYVLARDTVTRVRPDGCAAWRYSFEGPLVSGGALSPDGRSLALASWGRRLVLLDTENGQPRWTRSIPSGAVVAFSPDGSSLVAGGKTGIVEAFRLDGSPLFLHDLRPGSFIPNIEEFWAQHDRTVAQLEYGKNPPWHQVVQRDVPLSPNLLGLEGDHAVLGDPLEFRLPGDKLATYFAAMRFRAREGESGFQASIHELDAAGKASELRVGNFQAKPFPSEHYWIFKLSDRPQQVSIRLERPSGSPEILFEDLRLQKLEYPSENFLYHRGAYSRGKTPEVMDSAPVSAGVFHMQWGSHTVVWCDPFYLMDGHVFRRQKELEDGWWFGGPLGSGTARMKITPCAMVFELPEPRPVSHVALFDDEDGLPAERVCLQAWVETRDRRLNKSEAEEREIKPGYWRTIAKRRWNTDPFQVFKFEPILTDKIRFWYLRGPCKIDEIEVYGPEPRRTADWFDKAWIARIPVKVNKPADLAEVEFQPLGLTQPDGADLRVVSPTGQETPVVLKQLSPAGQSVLVFRTQGLTGTYYVYLGNDQAAMPLYDWRPEGGIWMESYAWPATVEGLNTQQVYSEDIMVKFFDASKAQALDARRKAEAEGKPFAGMKTGFVRGVGIEALPHAMTRYTFTMDFKSPQRLSFLAEAHQGIQPTMLRVNGQTVLAGWNAFDPKNPPPPDSQAVWKRWGDADVRAGLSRFEFTFLGHSDAYQFAPLTFRPSESRAERVLLISRFTCFPGARTVLPEKLQLQENQELGDFYLARARVLAEKSQFFQAQEMLLYAVKFLKKPAERAEAKSLAASVRGRIGETNWPMFHHDPARTGFSPSMTPPDGQAPSPDPSPFQKPSTLLDVRDQVECGIAATDLGVFFGTCLHDVRKLGAWSFTTGGILRGTPLVYGQRVYCGSMDGVLYCLTSGLGELVWKFPTGDGIAGGPLLVDDQLLFGSLDGYLYCLDPLEGQLLWKYRTEDWIEGSPATDGRLVFIGSYDDCLHAVHLQTGKRVWKYKTGFDVRSTPCVENGVVFFGSDDSFAYALKAADGSLAWKTPLGGYLPSSPAVSRGIVVFGSEDNQVYALDAASGSVRWTHRTGDDVQASPAIIGDQVCVPSNDNHLYVFRLSDGSLLARTPTLHAAPPATRSFRGSPAYHREALWTTGTIEPKRGLIQRWSR
ncbi:MAG: PQQ-binding-like beta-propeller repeat protein [Planctomycetes bacterium]|nr:PQQ-binding-like beta-propeller repeat protein [Planctomycetota bacterium]